MKKFKILPAFQLPLRQVVVLALALMGTLSLKGQNSASEYNNNVSGFTGVNCSGFGFDALISNNSFGTNNSALGHSALYTNTSGSRNTAMGKESLYTNTGDDNSAIGYQALYTNSSGSRNTAIGAFALSANTTGDDNTALGYNALISNTTEHNNTAIGANADIGTNTGYHYQTMIGYNTLPYTSGYDDCVSIGNTAVTLVESTGSYAYSSTSDKRFKYNIDATAVKGLDFINRLRPVVYNLDVIKETEFLTQGLPAERRNIYLSQDFKEAMAMRRSGFLAQEVEAAAKASGYDFSGVLVPKNDKGMYALGYATFVVPLVKALQEQQQMINSLEDEIAFVSQAGGPDARSKAATGIHHLSTHASTFSMEANRPNPFTTETVINFNLPSAITSAVLTVCDLSGNTLIAMPLNDRGASSVTITAEKLVPGIYIYSVSGDGKVLGAKRMIVSSKND